MFEDPNINSEQLMKIIEQCQSRLLRVLKKTCTKMIRKSTTTESRNEVILSIAYFSQLWDESTNFKQKWWKIITESSIKFNEDNDRLNSELELLHQEATTEYFDICKKLINL